MLLERLAQPLKDAGLKRVNVHIDSLHEERVKKLMRFVDLFWWILPNFRKGLAVTFADFGTPLLIGGIWLFVWAGLVRDKTLVPLREPRFTEHAHEVLAHHG